MTMLSERAMLVSLSITSWQGMMLDRTVTDEVNESYKADKEAGRYNKRLVAAKFLKGVSTAHSVARKIHRLYTLPWDDDGTRVLASTAYTKYMGKMREARNDVEEQVKEFLERPNDYIIEAKGRLAQMFNAEDYPDKETLEGKFSFDVEVKPFPEASDFRVQLSNETTKAIIKDIERRSKERLEMAMEDIFLRIQEKVKHLVDKLRDYQPATKEQKASGVIRDSVVYDVFTLANDMLPILNVTDDPRVNLLRSQMLSELAEHSPEILRVDAKVRQATITKADKMLKKLDSYLK